MLSHLASEHPASAHILTEEALSTALLDIPVDVHNSFLTPGLHERTAYDGLPIVRGYRCRHCPRAVGWLAERTLYHHHLRHHKPEPYNKHDLLRLDLQRYTNKPGVGLRYFPVRAKPEDGGDEEYDAIAEVFRLRLELYKAKHLTFDKETRRYDKWITTLAWVAAVQLYTAEQAKQMPSLIDLPDKGHVFYRVLAALQSIEDKAVHLIPQTTVLARRRLYTSEPQKYVIAACNALQLFTQSILRGLNHKPYDNVRTGNRHGRYVYQIFRVFLLLLRVTPLAPAAPVPAVSLHSEATSSVQPSVDIPPTAPWWRLDLPAQLADAVRSLRCCVAAPVEDATAIYDLVYTLFGLLVRNIWEPSADFPVPDPFLQTIMLQNLGDGLRWKSVKNVPPHIARLKRPIV